MPHTAPSSASPEPTSGRGGRQAVSRRNVVRTAAWSVPAVSIAAGSPAFAASSPEGTLEFKLAQFTGTRGANSVLPGGTGWFRVQNMEIRNTGPDALPAGLLVFTITVPTQWGNVTGPTPARPLPTGWSVSGYGTRTITLTPAATIGAIPANGDYDIADLGGAGGLSDTDLWFETSANDLLVRTLSATVSTSQAAPNQFTGDAVSGLTAGATWVI